MLKVLISFHTLLDLFSFNICSSVHLTLDLLLCAGGDLLSAITATFEKMRSDTECDDVTAEGWPDEEEDCREERTSRGVYAGECKLYRDPSLHRRTEGSNSYEKRLSVARKVRLDVE